MGLAAAAVGEFSPSFSSSLHVIRNCCSPVGGFFVNEQDCANKLSHDSHTGGGFDESWGRNVSGWRLVWPARDRSREENCQGAGRRIAKEGGRVTVHQGT